MAAKNFKFVSPGIFIDEIDNSQLPAEPTDIGPVVIGRTERGPGMRPVQVDSFSEFVEVFGNPMPGGQGGDIWRDGNKTAPTYASYAAQAWLRNNSPITVVRLLGEEHSQADTAGKAGWKMNTVTDSTPGGAYGLFLLDKPTNSSVALQTASLAAVFYTDTATSIVLTGNVGTMNDEGNSKSAADSHLHSGQGLIVSTGSDGHEFVALVKGTNGDKGEERINFNFTRTSDKYIRKVFNTNPTITNSTITSAGKRGYWLGETYDSHIESNGGTISSGVILGLASQDDKYDWSDWNFGSKRAETGYFISQDLGQSGSYDAALQQKLFKLVSLDAGEWLQKNLKVSIMDIKPSTNDFDPYGTFTVALRKISDSDNAPVYVEKFSNCSLNPNSSNYVARKIGDMYSDWDETDKKYKHYGQFINNSKFIRVSMDQDVDTGVTDARYIPMGFFGPQRMLSLTVSGNYSGGEPYLFVKSDQDVVSGSHATALFTGSYSMFDDNGNTDGLGAGAQLGASGSTFVFNFPKLPLRLNTDEGNMPRANQSFFGVRTSRSGSLRYDESIPDTLRIGDTTSAVPGGAGSDYLEDSLVFSLDDIVAGSNRPLNYATYSSGSRQAGISLSAKSGSSYVLETAKYNRFTTCFAGGFDGLDVTEREPFRNTGLSDGTETSNYAFYTVKRAVDAIADPEVVEYNLALIPGVTNTVLTEHLIKTCEDRGDALAIIDLENDYVPDTEGTSAESSRLPDVETTVTSLRDRGINSSYGCAYFPWVQLRDTVSNALLWAPPSVVALGTMAYSERQEALWFAPAGFTRGGLSEGAAGVPVLQTKMHLTSRDRDRLYEANINPIATFPAEGIVVFGQKTLQVTPSALDRVNVRRLLIHLKKEVSRIAATTLFEQNVQATWNRFSSQVETFLNNVKSGLGLTDFKVVLDETTTTPELVDRNILYAKVFLKPARSIEFIALDFVITDTGAAFAD